MVLTYIGISIEFYTIEQYLYSVGFGLLILISCYYMGYDTNTASGFLYLLFHFIRLRIETLNNKMKQMITDHRNGKDTTNTLRVSRQLVDHHIIICRQINQFNKFWSKYLLFLLITLIPLNLFLLNQVLFKDMQLYSYALNCFIVFISWVFVFFVSFCASQIPKGMHLTANKLYTIQTIISENNGPFNANIKLALLMCYEGVANSRVGFTVSSLFLMTNTVLFKVS
jgi:hypothetical protein